MHNLNFKEVKKDMDILVAIVMIGVIVSIIEMLYNLIKGKIVY